ncbi:uncharacterized protein MONBRDRAFT_27546 [Monosiga brevicollis MX1]|uniref:Transcription factor TFIIIB component B'' Myb domain-containing protein n=1 Tax=Monosiga brevicollis TaxID=81824 RepID=A9V5L2_MONBE|nr:uncharacterized protein MONBRDRAFT_27546 [Monosiga brevicollis MX1]EDQ87138.1 predicted protein [Monosiga brevicollis MX1]|eukprot:XP_001748081.1 hypothetical protein [Monosiga brevicollis MX1]
MPPKIKVAPKLKRRGPATATSTPVASSAPAETSEPEPKRPTVAHTTSSAKATHNSTPRVITKETPTPAQTAEGAQASNPAPITVPSPATPAAHPGPAAPPETPPQLQASTASQPSPQANQPPHLGATFAAAPPLSQPLASSQQAPSVRAPTTPARSSSVRASTTAPSTPARSTSVGHAQTGSHAHATLHPAPHINPAHDVSSIAHQLVAVQDEAQLLTAAGRLKKKRKARPSRPASDATMTMGDLIHYNPRNPRIEPQGSHDDLAQTRTTYISNYERPGQDDDDEDAGAANSVSNAPALKLVNGKLIVDEQSLSITARNAAPEPPPTTPGHEEERRGPRSTTSASFTRRDNNRAWSERETAKFFLCLERCGTDFRSMNVAFPKRSHKQLKAKYHREMKQRPDQVTRAIKNAYDPVGMCFCERVVVTFINASCNRKPYDAEYLTEGIEEDLPDDSATPTTRGTSRARASRSRRTAATTAEPVVQEQTQPQLPSPTSPRAALRTGHTGVEPALETRVGPTPESPVSSHTSTNAAAVSQDGASSTHHPDPPTAPHATSAHPVPVTRADHVPVASHGEDMPMPVVVTSAIRASRKEPIQASTVVKPTQDPHDQVEASSTSEKDLTLLAANDAAPMAATTATPATIATPATLTVTEATPAAETTNDQSAAANDTAPLTATAQPSSTAPSASGPRARVKPKPKLRKRPHPAQATKSA